MATTATIPINSIPIGMVGSVPVLIHPEWMRFLRDIQSRSGGVTGVAQVPSGGTGFSAYTVGDMLYADTTASLARLNAAASGNALLSGASPSWGKVGLTTHVSGILGEANGGTGFAAFGGGISAWLQSPTSANLAAALTDETGTGANVFADGPVLSAPVLGTPASGNLSNCTGYPVGSLSGTVTVAQGGTGITSGNSGGIPYYSSSSTIASSPTMPVNRVLLGGGSGGSPIALGSLGTTTTVLHGNAAGAPTFGAVSLTADVTGTLPVANGGTGITALGAGVATFLATPSSANLAAALTDETGTGANVFANTPTLVTPVIGAATGTSVSLSSTATASAFIPSGSAVPVNGMYLPAADSVGISTNSTQRIFIDASGNVLPVTVGVFGSAGNPWGAIYSSGNIRGGSLSVAEGANAKQGTATLVAGASVVANTSVTANSRIQLTSQVDGGTPGWLRVSARVVGTSFTITSSSGTDTSTVAYLITEPG